MYMPPSSDFHKTRRRLWLGVAGAAALALLLWGLFATPRSNEPRKDVAVATEHPAGPPWRHGPATARFTIVVYADLECPFCQAYTPVLRNWIDANPDVNLQWHHLPLPMHEPAASEEARWVECVGETFGHARFWEAVAWIYQHTRSDGKGLPVGVDHPDEPAVQACLDSNRPGTAVRIQADQARKDGLDATPSLRLIDNESKRTMLLTGSVEGDTLLSALDLLSSPEMDEPSTGAVNVIDDLPESLQP